MKTNKVYNQHPILKKQKIGHNSNKKGFTLIEVLVSSALLVIIGAGYLGLQYMMSKSQVVVFNGYLSVEEANSIVTQMINEIRNARQSDDGAYLLDTANDQEIVFYSDIDGDGVTERVRYTLSNNLLTKGVTEPTGNPPIYDLTQEKAKIVSSNIRNGAQPVFYYYNKDWPIDTTNNPLPSAYRIADTTIIKVILRENTNSSSPNTDYVLESDATIRMLKLN